MPITVIPLIKSEFASLQKMILICFSTFFIGSAYVYTHLKLICENSENTYEGSETHPSDLARLIATRIIGY